MIIGLDFVHLWFADPEFPAETSWMAFKDYGGWPALVPLLLVSLGAYPRVDVYADRLEVYNPVRTITIPRAQYLGVCDGAFGYVKITTSQGGFYALGLEQFNVEGSVDERELIPQMFLDYPVLSVENDCLSAVTWKWRAPTWYETVVYAGLLSYYVLALSVGPLFD